MSDANEIRRPKDPPQFGQQPTGPEGASRPDELFPKAAEGESGGSLPIGQTAPSPLSDAGDHDEEPQSLSMFERSAMGAAPQGQTYAAPDAAAATQGGAPRRTSLHWGHAPNETSQSPSSRGSRASTLLAAAALLFSGAAVGSIATSSAWTHTAERQVTFALPELASGVSTIAAAALPQVYSIAEISDDPAQQRSGTAVAYRSDGYLITNYHVVGESGSVSVISSDGTRYTGEVVGGHARTDIAVVKIPKTLNPPRWGVRAAVPGELAVAVGSPFGFDGTVTAGVVSAVDRSAGMVNGAALYGMIQTDASINPGNSGGPLMDAEGRVIGVNTAIFTRTGQGQGLGFAIPAAVATRVADQIIATGRFEPGFLGVVSSDSEGRAGAQVREAIEGLPAARSGILPGDLIVAVNSLPVRGSGELLGRVGVLTPGTTVQVTLIREGRTLTISTTLATAPDDIESRVAEIEEESRQENAEPGEETDEQAPEGPEHDQ